MTGSSDISWVWQPFTARPGGPVAGAGIQVHDYMVIGSGGGGGSLGPNNAGSGIVITDGPLGPVISVDDNTVVRQVLPGTNVVIGGSRAFPVVNSSGGGGGGLITEVQAGANISVDNTDPTRPIVSTSGAVISVTGGPGIHAARVGDNITLTNTGIRALTTLGGSGITLTPNPTANELLIGLSGAPGTTSLGDLTNVTLFPPAGAGRGILIGDDIDNGPWYSTSADTLRPFGSLWYETIDSVGVPPDVPLSPLAWAELTQMKCTDLGAVGPTNGIQGFPAPGGHGIRFTAPSVPGVTTGWAFKVDASITIQAASGTGKRIQFGIFKNADVSPISTLKTMVVAESTRFFTATVTSFIDLADNDYLTMKVRNMVDGTNIILWSGHLTLDGVMR